MDIASFFSILSLSFLAATILPFSSESAVIAARFSGYEVWMVLVSASVGNGFGILLNYYLGRLGGSAVRAKMERSKSGRRSLAIISKYGTLSVLLSWLPVIGDPITILAGSFRLPFMGFMAPALLLRTARYALLLYFPAGT